MSEKSRKQIREELKMLPRQMCVTPVAEALEYVDEILRLQEQLQSAQQEIEALRQERNKLIEGLRKLAKTNAENISEIREWKAKQNDPEVIDLDWYNYVARDILKEIGVMDV